MLIRRGKSHKQCGLMGMANLFWTMTHPWKLWESWMRNRYRARNLTLSTVGYVPGIKALMKEKLQINSRYFTACANWWSQGIPYTGMRKWKVREIINTAVSTSILPGESHIWILSSWRVNDSEQNAYYCRLLKKLNCHVNVIPFNPVTSIPFKRPAPSKIDAFVETC